MKITDQSVVALTWTLKDTLNETLDTLDEPVEFLVGGGDLLQALEQALHGHQVGDEVALQLEPEQAFGDYNEQLVFLEAKNLFPAEVEEGMVFEGLPPGANRDAPTDLLYFVTDIYPDHLVLDANHPLAGIALRITMKVHTVRPATEEEVGRGSLGTGFFKVQPNQATTPDTEDEDENGADGAAPGTDAASQLLH